MSRVKGSKKTGGKKKGSKHKKTIEQEMALEEMRKVLREKMFDKDGLIAKKLELANGIYVMKPIRVGGVVVDVKVYKEKPDGQSLEYLMSMVVGRPTERQEVEVGMNKEIKEVLDKIAKLIK